MLNLVYYGRVENGSLKIQNRNGLKLDLKSLEGKEVEIKISKKKKRRSNQQNSYYWGVVIPIVREGLIEAGFPRDVFSNTQAVHELLKSMFCPKVEVINEDTGEVLQLPPTTTNLSTVNMMEYFEDIRQWGAEFLGIYIPEPNEALKINF